MKGRLHSDSEQAEAINGHRRSAYDAAKASMLFFYNVRHAQSWSIDTLKEIDHLIELNRKVVAACCSGCADITHTHTCGDPTKQPQLEDDAPQVDVPLPTIIADPFPVTFDMVRTGAGTLVQFRLPNQIYPAVEATYEAMRATLANARLTSPQPDATSDADVNQPTPTEAT
jgi:hypothetical protein